MEKQNQYDAILVVSFGGPNQKEDVLPFLENVLRGRPVPPGKIEEVAQHYYHFGGKSPLNEQNLDLIKALQSELNEHKINLPIYFGNRNWHPMLVDTLAEMKEKGVRKALAFFTSSMSSYSGCRQYRENIIAAQKEIGEGAPEVDKIRVFYNHPLFVEAMKDRIIETFQGNLPHDAHFLFTTHSIPSGMAKNCNYEKQFHEATQLVAKSCNLNHYSLCYQSRSGPPKMPWLGPDVVDEIERLHQEKIQKIAIVPLGFLSDHMEVMFDLDTEAKEKADECNMEFFRVPTVGTHPKFIQMIRELIVERMNPQVERRFLGESGASHDVCPKDCCLPG